MMPCHHRRLLLHSPPRLPSLQFAFILPLIFYNKYIDDSRWESRFQLMTLQVMSVPLQLGSIFVLNRWRRTRVDGRAMDKLNELKIAKADRYDKAGAAAAAAAAAEGAPAAAVDRKTLEVDRRRGSVLGKLFGFKRGGATGGNAAASKSTTSSRWDLDKQENERASRKDMRDARQQLVERFEERRGELLEAQGAKEESIAHKVQLIDTSEELQAEIDELQARLGHAPHPIPHPHLSPRLPHSCRRRRTTTRT